MSKPLKLQLSTAQIAAIRTKAKQTTEYYYCESAANVARKIIEQLHETKLPVRVRPEGYKVNTLRVQYYQGLRYLLDNLDPSGRYSKLAKATKCSTSSNEYAEFTLRGTLMDPVLESVIPWRDKLNHYLDTAEPGKKFYEPDVSLTPTDITWIEGQLAGLLKANGEPLFIAQVEVGQQLLLIRDEN